MDIYFTFICGLGCFFKCIKKTLKNHDNNPAPTIPPIILAAYNGIHLPNEIFGSPNK